MNALVTTNIMADNEEIAVEFNIQKKRLLRARFFPLGNGLTSPHSEGDLLIYSLLPWSQHFVTTVLTMSGTASTISTPEHSPPA